jgi:uncharacterized membrane protein YgcG
MALDTDLSRKPYFDDYDVTKNFYRVLYRPAAAVQARELNQMQTIMQDQIDKFGRHIFKEGSVIEGCAFTFDSSYNYVKIKDNYANNSAISNINDFVYKIVINSNGLQATVVNANGGFESSNTGDLNTLYLKYLNSATYANGLQQSTFSNGEVIQIRTSANVNIGNVVVATVANSTGKGYAFTTTEGVIFKKGFFIRVEPQTLVVTKYDNVPDNISVGFDADEQIITPEIDTSLLDNAAGSPNYDAPGAHRLKLVPTLVTRVTNTTSTNTSSFFSLCDFKNGLPISVKNDPQYAALAKDTARRTYETNGDYIVNPFLLSTSNKITNNTVNTAYNSIISSPGIGYVKGYRVEFVNNNTADLRKGLDYAVVNNQIVTATFGYYFNVNEFCGDFNNKNATQVELHSAAKTAITNRNFLSGYSASTKIGTAYVRGVSYGSGTPGVDAVYEIYIFNIAMLPGQKLSDVRSVIYYSGSMLAVADIILDKDFSGVSIAKVQASNGELMVYPFGQNAIRPEGFSTTARYVYRNRVNSSFVAVSGSLSLTIPAVVGTGTEVFNYSGTLSEFSEKSFIVLPSANGYSTVKTGNVSINATSANVVGTSTAFLSQYQVGDYFYSSANTRRVVSITSDTSMTVDSVFSGAAANLPHQKIWPTGVPINFAPSARTITITSNTTATVALGEAANADFTTSVYFDTLRINTVPIAKQIKKSTYIKIQANTNAAGVTGPWCLGVPDVLRLNAVYIDETGGTYANTNSNITGSFRLNNGQQDAYYGLAYISSRRPIAPNSTLLVSVDNFVAVPSDGVGFFTANSYPIDDANTSNTSAIRIYEIPQYTSTIGTTVDLRDSIDFRPYAVNTALANATIATATINPSNTVVLQTYGAGGSYLVSPDSNYESTVQYYLPRKDRIALSTAGQMLVTEGESSLVPVPPNEIPGTMTIGFVTVPPYPSLTSTEAKLYNRYDYSIQTTLLQTKRYTMADINKLSKRIEKLEYYTSLSLLEQATNALTVRSDSTGQNRFKNGILVDPFKDHSIGNTNDGTYNISIDRNSAEARPAFNQITASLQFDSTASTAVKAGDLILLPYTANNLNQSQQFASKYRNCIEGNIYNYRGTLKVNPPGITSADLLQKPLINGSIDNYTNFVDGGRSSGSRFGTEWGNWTDAGSPTITGQDSQTNLTAASQTSQTFRTTTTTTLAQQQTRIGKRFTTQPTETTVDVGDYVTDVSIQTFVPSTDVYFTAKGMKPNTKLYVYFDNINVSIYCLNLSTYLGSWTQTGGDYVSIGGAFVYIAHDGTVYYHTNNWGGQITSDSYGNVYGIFKIPTNVFKSGQLEFKLTDIPDLTQGESAVTTQATYSMFCSALSVQKQKSLLTIRGSQIVTEEVAESQVIYQNTSNSTEFTNQLPGGGSGGGSGGGGSGGGGSGGEESGGGSVPPVEDKTKPTPKDTVYLPEPPLPEPPTPDREPWLPPFVFGSDADGNITIVAQRSDDGLSFVPLPPPSSPVVPVNNISIQPVQEQEPALPDPVQPPVVAVEPEPPTLVFQIVSQNGDGTSYFDWVEAPPPDEYIVYSYGD